MSGNRTETARKVLALIDLTDLNATSSDTAVAALCAKAATQYGKVAAICVWPRFVKGAKPLLKDTGIRIATVVNFPGGDEDSAPVVMETEKAIKDGAHEIDLVFPYRAFMKGEHELAGEQIAIIASVCHGRALLKVIIETGELRDQKLIKSASELAIAEGADFIKTSTGKVQINASLAASETMLNAIKAFRRRDVGLKPAGGIRTVDEAAKYLELADSVMGPDWATPATFRFGASGLLDDCLAVLSGKASASVSNY
jgi:deoxyribose-phosphate aldolase